jgi:Na+-transporting methylmalonyl-CoA/oxaloacetate decarboxylase gamma subunit
MPPVLALVALVPTESIIVSKLLSLPSPFLNSLKMTKSFAFLCLLAFAATRTGSAFVPRSLPRDAASLTQQQQQQQQQKTRASPLNMSEDDVSSQKQASMLEHCSLPGERHTRSTYTQAARAVSVDVANSLTHILCVFVPCSTTTGRLECPQVGHDWRCRCQ